MWLKFFAADSRSMIKKENQITCILMCKEIQSGAVAKSYMTTSGFWPRMRARALRAPVFLSSLPPQTGRCAPPPRPSQLLCFLFDPQKYLQPIELGPPTSRAFFFPLDHRGYEKWGPLPVKIMYRCDHTPLFFYSFWIFSFCYSLIFLLSFSISSYSALLISSYSSL